jgi:uncharacterized membrane protein
MRVRLPGLYIALCVVLAGLIHIAAVLTLPMLAPRDAHARLAALGPANKMIQLPLPAPGRQVMPLMAPDVRYAICRYDLSKGPVRLKARIADGNWLIAFYTPLGENYYTVVGGDLKRPDVDLIVAMSDQTVAEVGVDSPEAFDNVVVVNSPVEEGIALVRVPLTGQSRSVEAERALKATYCGTHKGSNQPSSP